MLLSFLTANCAPQIRDSEERGWHRVSYWMVWMESGNSGCAMGKQFQANSWSYNDSPLTLICKVTAAPIHRAVTGLDEMFS